MLAEGSTTVSVARLDLASGAQTDLSPVLQTEAFTGVDRLWWFWEGSAAIGIRNGMARAVAVAIE